MTTLLTLSAQAQARDRIRIVGSSEVLGFAQPVAEQFVRHWHIAAPSLQVTGTGGGFDLFCAGVGFEHPDAVAAARPMSEAERAACAEQGVTEVTEIEFGRDAMVFIHAGQEPRIDLTRRQLFAALATEVAGETGIMENTAQRWSDVDPALPGTDILVMAPEPNTTAAIAFQELVLAEGCRSYPEIVALEESAQQRVCRSLRSDGRVVNAAKREDGVVAWLEANEHGYAVTSYTTYKKFPDRTAVNSIETVEPSDETIGSHRYPLVTGVYLYVKDRHVAEVPGFQKFLYELTSERALAPDGYLVEQGLVSLDEITRNRARDLALRLGM
ncbi:MAG: substrate-binding domain-containing protein [Gammaproteobacteria bacterium]|jgi:phosphate transport system substrate-binding protein